MRRRRKVISVLVVLTAAVGGTLIIGKGCGCVGLPPGWRAEGPASPPADLMAGEWEGSWASDSKLMGGGGMTAYIEKLPDGTYEASFTSETPFGADKSMCVFRVMPQGKTWAFEGKENLGLLKGGTYTYKGTVDGKDFVCTYDSTFDKGVFRMHRPQASSSQAATTTRTTKDTKGTKGEKTEATSTSSTKAQHQ